MQRLAELEEWCQGLGLHSSNLDEQITAARREVARLREALETAIEKLDEDAQWSGQRNVACHCHPEYVKSCPDCGAVAPNDAQNSYLARPPSGKHEDGCGFVSMMAELRDALATCEEKQ